MKKLILFITLLIPVLAFADSELQEIDLIRKDSNSNSGHRLPDANLMYCLIGEDEIILEYPDEWGMIYVTLTNTTSSIVQSFETYSGIPLIAKLSGTMIIEVITCDGSQYYGIINI